MKAFPLSILSLAVGAVAGAGLAYFSVGPSPAGFTPFDGPSGPAQGVTASLATPEVQVDSATYDFGVMQRGATQSHEFIFKNTGGAPLSLRVGETSCKCTLGEVSEHPLAPGESTPVKLEWTAKTVEGPFRQAATVHTNDPRQPRVELAVEGRVAQTMGLSPQDFALGTFAAGEAKEASVLFAAFDQANLQVTASMVEASPNRDQYQVQVTPLEAKDFTEAMEGAKAGVRIDLKSTGKLPLGFINDWVQLKTNVPKSKTLQIPVFGVVEGEISVHGGGWNKEAGVLVWGTIKQTAGKKSILRISTKGAQADKIDFSVAEVDPPELKATLGQRIPVREGVTHVPLTLEISPGTKPMAHNNSAFGEDAIVKLKSNHPVTPEMTLRVRFAVTP